MPNSISACCLTLLILSACRDEVVEKERVEEERVEKDCSDGVDNDTDGLMDCEDGDCFSDGYCNEDCTDGIDNNDNGQIDLEDDVCAISVQATGGSMRIQHSRMWEWSGYTGWRETTAAIAENVTGLLWVQNQVCTWTVDYARFERVQWGGDWQVSYDIDLFARRDNLQLSPDCPQFDHYFLPMYGVVHLSESQMFADWKGNRGDLWYQGTLFDSTSSEGSSPQDKSRWSVESWFFELGSGDVLYPPSDWKSPYNYN
jgi:hypothetical protein